MNVPVGEPKLGNKPPPSFTADKYAWISLFTIATACFLFILWRRADSVRRVVEYRLKSIGERQGDIRLSEEDGPTVEEFLVDEDLDEEPLPPGDITTQARPVRK